MLALAINLLAANQLQAFPRTWSLSKGTVQSLNTGSQSFTLREADSEKTRTLAITKNTKFYRDGKLLPIRELRPGAHVVVTRRQPFFTPGFATKVIVEACCKTSKCDLPTFARTY